MNSQSDQINLNNINDMGNKPINSTFTLDNLIFSNTDFSITNYEIAIVKNNNVYKQEERKKCNYQLGASNKQTKQFLNFVVGKGRQYQVI